MSKELINRIIYKLKKNIPFSVIVETEKLDKGEEAIIMNILQNKGFSRNPETGEYIYTKNSQSQVSNFYIRNPKSRFKLCLLSDTHIASKCDRIDALDYVYEKGTKRNVDYYLHGGDFFEGIITREKNPSTFLKEQKPIKQVEYAAKHYPKGDVPTIVIDGNHEEVTNRNHQINMLSELTKIRNDLLYLRSTKANLQIGNLRLLLEHGTTNKKSQKELLIKRTVDSYALKARPRIVVTGHSHTRSYEEYGVTHIYQVPSLMSQRCPQIHYKNSADNGVWWLELEIDSNGNIISLIQEPEAITNQFVKKLY